MMEPKCLISARLAARPVIALAAAFLLAVTLSSKAQEVDYAKRLEGFDAYMEKTLKDWNAPAVAVGVVVGDKVVFAKGYGFADVGKKVPMSARTVCPIASNTKLFTAVAAGLLVEEGKLDWNEPIREKVPSIRFANDALNSSVSLRDMLAHRTGITRHDFIWYRADFTRKELFERLKFMEPKEPIRTTFLYNNMMFMAVGYAIELQSGKTWEEFVRTRLFEPLGMTSSGFTIEELKKAPDHGVPYTERRESDELYEIPYYEDTEGMAPCGAIVSNVEDMTRWLIALMNDGKFEGRQVIPASVLKETLTPAVALPNSAGLARGWWELVNSTYGMGRNVAVYRGKLYSYHGGDINGFHSQVSMMPQEKIGVVVLEIGDHCAMLRDAVGYNVYERLLGMDPTPWSDRYLALYKKGKQAGKEGRAKAGADRVPNAPPSHVLKDYAGTYEHPAYGEMPVTFQDGKLTFGFRAMNLPLEPYHYERFDTPDHEEFGKWSLNFQTNPQGDVDKVVVSLDEKEVTFVRRPESLDEKTLALMAGTYETATGMKFEVLLKEGVLYLAFPGRPADPLVHYKGTKFRLKEYSDLILDFVMEGGKVKGLNQISADGQFMMYKK
ncbi:MAG: serine hydrolase [Acidobacteriota bacterium]